MSAQEQVLEQIVRFWEDNQLLTGCVVVVGVSGGTDSLVLMHACAAVKHILGIHLHIATLNHELRGTDGAEDAAFVERMAQAWGLDVTVGKVDVHALAETYGMNVEEAARQARYSFLLRVAREMGAVYVLVGHNHDDQAETVLMHVIRGTGLGGLRGMLPVTPFGDYHLFDENEEEDFYPEDYSLLRPLLTLTRATIRQYADDHQLTPREDHTNADLTRFRNTLRHDILPRLQQLNPNIRQTLTRLADVTQAEYEVIASRIESVAAWMLEWADTEPTPDYPDGGEVVFIDLESFAQQHLAIQRGVVRKIIIDLAPYTRNLSFEQTEQIRLTLLSGNSGTRFQILNDLYLARGYDEAMIGYGGSPHYPDTMPRLKRGQYVALDLDGQGFIQGNQRLITYWVVEGLSQDLYPADPLECTLAIPENAKLALRTRRDGDRFRPFGLGGKSQKLSDTFTNLKVPSYYRDHVPLLTVDDEIAWFVVPTATGPVGRIAEPFAVQNPEGSILRVRWQMDKTTGLFDNEG